MLPVAQVDLYFWAQMTLLPDASKNLRLWAHTTVQLKFHPLLFFLRHADF